ncbi:4-oxalocrotonate tautomerase family protein [Halogeometricum sp. S1BR25-6]|uniref:4-oxalocrotonate tautomerase family protein n=1 Tax=Halogeometricum salsisoli TaxID=2950536 RepID=A0ABU2GEG3_9EURY|nr:tautomerase family protein [Halogeometricum sp. S1BR25-6]MDS0299206.1 4-oxalocrotonate tautomerase family protein [Halogeometricum sp. S1BR25-6]
MPLLQFDTTAEASAEERERFTAAVTDLYAEEMATTTGHVAVVIREHPPANLSLGRAEEGPLCFLSADIREGRSFERKRSFALAAMELAAERFSIPETNLKVSFTEHAGEELMGVDRVGGEWSPTEEDGE